MMAARHSSRIATVVSLVLVAAALPAWGQVRFTIDPKASLAWWQVNPNMSHLWATTCPEDPAWQPGEGRSIGYMVDYLRRNTADATQTSRLTPHSHIPIYPRKVVRSLCTPAVSGEVTAADTVSWRGVQGDIAIRTENLRTGLDFRDEYARKAIYASDQFPEMRFHIDSLVNVRRMPGDSMVGTAFGTYTFRSVPMAMQIPVRIHRVGGGLRVRGQAFLPAHTLTDTWGISRLALGLSVALNVWRELHFGVDVVLRPAGS
jgi:hypothetical protein